MGHDAVGAEIVAPLHDGDEPADAPLHLGVGEQVEPALVVEKGGLGTAFPPLGTEHHVLQQVQGMGAEDQIHEGGLLQESLPLLLGDTAPHADDQPGLPLLHRLELAEVAVHLLLRLSPD